MCAAAALDFGALPPEINSGLMYAGAGSGPLMAASAAWAGLADELGSAAADCTAVLSELTGTGWHGPAAASMTAAAAPYTTWLQATAGHAARAATQAAAAAGAYELAFAATVPPAVVAANRALLASLVATNVLGQNTPAIAATEAAYSTMWAQDAGAMYHYAAHSAAATALSPLAQAPSTTTDTASAGQAAATAHAVASSSASTPGTLSQLISSLPNMLQSMGLNLTGPGGDTSTTGLQGILDMFSGASGATPFSNFMNSTLVNSAIAGAPYSPAFIGQAIGDMTAMETVLGRTLGTVAGAAGLSSATAPLGAVAAGEGLSGIGTLAGAHTGAAAAAVGGSAAPATAEIGKATLVRALSVPPTWAAAAAPVEAITPAAVAAPVAVAPTASPILTSALPPSAARGMVDEAENEDGDGPLYGFATKALVKTPAGG